MLQIVNLRCDNTACAKCEKPPSPLLYHGSCPRAQSCPQQSTCIPIPCQVEPQPCSKCNRPARVPVCQRPAQGGSCYRPPQASTCHRPQGGNTCYRTPCSPNSPSSDGCIEHGAVVPFYPNVNNETQLVPFSEPLKKSYCQKPPTVHTNDQTGPSLTHIF
ncbi:hypothetical protein M8J76_016468 [Diaphorina citri]|nr:hypothetical protein M8J75_009953 [Diaphorina citri]KAI5730691.1 hypothetical protein M8J76_016468 [Diaphorina citri]KAI5734109.1 hypothetical protein M8J77_002571 [Diaphorina citri]